VSTLGRGAVQDEALGDGQSAGAAGWLAEGGGGPVDGQPADAGDAVAGASSTTLRVLAGRRVGATERPHARHQRYHTTHYWHGHLISPRTTHEAL